MKMLFSSPRAFGIVSKVFRTVAVSGKGSDRCLAEGFLPVPINYYSPIPDIIDLEERKVWDQRSDLSGIRFRVDQQLELLEELGRNYGEECRWRIDPGDNPAEFYIQNPSFSYGCAASTHCIIRHMKPSRVIEIGSGMSTRVIAEAVRKNEADGQNRCEYTIVDPFPGKSTKPAIMRIDQIRKTRVELLDAVFFEPLAENDILFIDSGHCVRIGGDVNFLYLDVLPRLRKGVIVHIHDISLPYEYPKVYATNETFRQFWTEQYLLQALLCHNDHYEILLAMNFILRDHPERFERSFPHYDPVKHKSISSSFWIRRRTG
jgi:hypothetical protein